jgi:hypothetical protein
MFVLVSFRGGFRSIEKTNGEIMSDEGDERIERVLRALDQTISQLNKRLTDIENRLNQQQGRSPIMEERKVPDEQGLLGGKVFFTNQAGGIEKEVRIPVCDICGRSLSESFFVCQNCTRKLCQKCVISYSGQTLCLECLRQQVPLTKRNFKVLVAVANGLESSATISQLVQIKRDEAEQSLQELHGLGLIGEKGLAIFSHIYATDKGLEAIAVYSQVFGRDGDVIQFNQELRSLLAERMS